MKHIVGKIVRTIGSISIEKIESMYVYQLVQRIEKESYGEKAPQWIKIFF